MSENNKIDALSRFSTRPLLLLLCHLVKVFFHHPRAPAKWQKVDSSTGHPASFTSRSRGSFLSSFRVASSSPWIIERSWGMLYRTISSPPTTHDQPSLFLGQRPFRGHAVVARSSWALAYLRTQSAYGNPLHSAGPTRRALSLSPRRHPPVHSSSATSCFRVGFAPASWPQ
jgi:hypothetical protein